VRAQRVFLTGASGFVGAAVVNRMVQEGRSVAILLRQSSNMWRIADIQDNVTIIRGDMQSINSLKDAISRFAPDAVAHLAWKGVKGADRNTPEQVENVFEAISLYRLVRSLGVRKFIGLGSQAEYGPCSARVDELTPTRPTTTYGAAKLATYLLLDRLSAADGFPFVWLRLFSSYGPKDDPSWLLPYIAKSLLRGERPALTMGEQVWDYIHIDDVVSAVLEMIDNSVTGVFNLGSGQAKPLHEIITRIRDLIDPALPLGFGELPYRPDQVMHLEANIDKLTTETAWRPAVSLDLGLKSVADFYRQWNLPL